MIHLLMALCLFGYTNLNAYGQDAFVGQNPLEQQALGLDQNTDATAPEMPAERGPEIPLSETAPPQISAPALPTETLQVREPVPSDSPALTPDTTVPLPNSLSTQHKPGERLVESRRNKWAASIAYSARAFRQTEWRAGVRSPTPNLGRARFMGLYLSGERILFDKLGVASVGAEAYMVGNPVLKDFENTSVAGYGAGLYASYRPRIWMRQWVVPYVRGGGEAMRYNYLFNSSRITGYRLMPRAEAGLDIFLNFLDPSAAGDMYGNNTVKRTYLYAAYSFTQDSSQKDGLNLSDRSLRFGLRFDF